MGNTKLFSTNLSYTRTTILQHYFSKKAFAAVAKGVKKTCDL